MNKNFTRAILVICSFILLFSVNSNAQKVIHYWDFNNTLPSGGAGGDSLGTSTYPLNAPYTVLPGANPRIVYSHPVGGGILDNGAPAANQEAWYNDLHILGNDTAGVATNNLYVRSRNPDQGAYMYLYLPTTGYTNVTLNYAISVSSTKGANYNLLSYSNDGGSTWNNLTSAMDTFATHNKSNGPDSLSMITTTPGESKGTAWTPETINFSSDLNTNNNPDFVVRWTFLAPSNTGTSGNDRYDNISLVGDSVCPGFESQASNVTLCGGSGNASFSVAVQGGTTPYTYQWFVNSGSGYTALSNGGLYNGVATTTLTVTGATGSVNGYLYQCRVTSPSLSCGTIASTATLTVDPALIASVTSFTNVTCAGNGGATASQTGGTSPYTYSWSPGGQTLATATNLTAGTYTVTVTDAVGCSATAKATISQNGVAVNITSQINIGCLSTGSATASASNGTSPYTYLWNDGETTRTATGLSAGGYTVTVHDHTNCLGSAIGTILNIGQIRDSIISLTQVIHYWDFNNLTPSTTDSLGTSAYPLPAEYTLIPGGNATITYSRPSAIQSPATIRDSILDDGAGGAFVNELNNLPAIYAALGYDTVTNGNQYIRSRNPDKNAYMYLSLPTTGFTNIQVNYAIQESSTGGAQYNILSYSVNGGSSWHNLPTSVDTFSVGGNPTPDTLTVNGKTNWTAFNLNFSGIASVNNNPGFMIRWKFAGSNSASSSANIRYDNVSVTGTAEEYCNGGNNIALTAGVKYGQAPYTYSWSPSGGTGSVASNLSAGTYTVNITDANGCSASSTTTISQPAVLSVAASVSGAGISCNGGTANASVSISGGTSPYTYSWSPGAQTSKTATGLSVGTYTITVTDNCGTSSTSSVTVTQPNVLTTAITSYTNVTCLASGSATVSVSGGTSPYTYLWNDASSQTTVTAVNLTAGTYTVAVTDLNGCSSSANVTITQPANSVLANIASYKNAECTGYGSATATQSGGTSPYSYSWTPIGGNNATGTGLTAGNYTVTVYDHTGCSSSASVTISTVAQLRDSIVSLPVIDYWDFNNLTPVTSYTNITAIPAQYSVVSGASIQYNPNALGGTGGGFLESATGGTGVDNLNYFSPINTALGNDSSSGNLDIKALNPAANAQMTLVLPTSGYSNIVLNYAIEASSSTSAPEYNNISYSTNGGSTWNTITSAMEVEGSFPSAGELSVWSALSWSPVQLNFSTDPAVNNNPNFEVKWTFSTPNTGTSGNDRYDNISLSGSPIESCISGNNVALTAGVKYGALPYTYSWSPSGQTNAIATNLTAGTYTVNITDALGCSVSSTYTVSQPTTLSTTASTTNISCYGGTANASANVSGGSPAYIYSWSPGGQTNATATGLLTGNYTVTVHDNCGASSTASITLTQPGLLEVGTSESNVLCYGGFGSGTASVSGGVSPYTYLWNDGSSQVTASATGLSAGNYTVSVTDNHGCSINASVTITEPASGLAANASITTNVLCYGSNTGIAVSAPSGGTSPYTYLWSNNETAASATGLSAGNYTVTVSDNHGCSTTAGITIIEPSSALGVSISGHTNGSGCGSNGNATASISGGTSPYTYLWSNTETTATATGLAGGTFTITATDNHGCVANATVVITQAPEIAISIASQTNVLCYGGTGSAVANAATGGTSPYTYMWSNGKSTLSVTGLSAGNYTITATGHNGCSTNAYVTITQPAAALESSVASLTNASCHGEHGSASIGVSGGTSPYTYSWTPNVSSVATASGLTAGTYTVIVKDLHGCADAKVTVIITQPGTLRDSLVADSKLTELDEPFSNVSCNGGDNGKITIGVKAGTAPYTYSWTPNVSTTATATGLTAGTYSVLVTDKNGCSGTAGTLSITITQPTGLRDSISVLTEVACNGETGAATIGVKGGTSPYTYVWEPIGKTKAAEIGLSAGIYTVTVTDHNGCGNSVVVTITQPAPIRDSVIAASYLYPLCHGEATGSATVGIKGGTSPYTYTWSKGATNNTTAIGTGLSAGTYTVVVKDAHGCEEGKGVVIVVITQPGSIRDSSVTVDKANVSCNGGNNGQITVGVKYGTPPYTYTWTPNVSTTATATGLTAGTYTISITDINACSSSVSTLKVVVTQPSVLRDSLIGLTQISCNGGSGSVGVGVKGGTSPYTYAWSPIGKTTAKISDLTVGTYTVTVTDKHGCGNTLEAIITQPGVFYDSVASISYPVCHGETGSATVGVKGGTSPYTYSWSKGAISTTGSATGLLAGTYTLTIEDAHKCTEIKRTIVITQPAAIRDSSIVADRINISCNGGDNGSATAGVRYGVSPFTYLWSPGDQTTATATGLTAGTYTLTVTDNNGCSSTTKETAIITQPSVLTATIANVCKAGVGSFTASGSGGVSPYTYSWNNGSTNKEITGLSSGVFTVTVTDKNGCEATAEASVCPPSDYTGPTGENTDSYSSNQAIDIVLYPNPNTGQFTITGLQKEMLIEVYSYTGQRIRSLTTNGDGALQMSLSDQPNGIYLIRILSSNGNILSLKKVVKTQ